MDNRTKIAAAWWTDSLRRNHQNDALSTQDTQNCDTLSEQQLEAFEAALAREIAMLLPQGLTHVLAVNHRWSAPQFRSAAASCGIDGICDKLPRDTVMRIFPDTVMMHSGPLSKVEILWTSNKSLSGRTENKASA